jgi:uncharacterized protein YceK
MKILLAILAALLLSGCCVVIVRAPMGALYHHEQTAEDMTIDQNIRAVDDISGVK